MRQELKKIRSEAQAALQDAQTPVDVEALRVRFLGKKGSVSQILKAMGQLAADERKEVGQLANTLRDDIETWIDSHVERLQGAKREKSLSEQIDITLPGRVHARGHRHPLTQASDKVLEVLRGLGFETVHGPEIEHDFYNFEALNIPRDHPARAMQDTFYVDKDVVLRTQTSPVQIRTMLAHQEPPIRIASVGRVFRHEQDVTHSPMFHQIEGLYVAPSVTFADLKGTLTTFVEKVFSPSSRLRLRPSYFPFTEPSAEVDMSCFACNGEDTCRLCKGTGWIEILGAGMVDPAVFETVGIDAEKYTGFAFGMGVERIAMLRYAILDIRHFYENDLRFLGQF